MTPAELGLQPVEIRFNGIRIHLHSDNWAGRTVTVLTSNWEDKNFQPVNTGGLNAVVANTMQVVPGGGYWKLQVTGGTANLDQIEASVVSMGMIEQ